MKNQTIKLFNIFMIVVLLTSCATNPVKQEKEITVEYYDNKGNFVTKKKKVGKQPEVTGNFELINKGDAGYLNVSKFRKKTEANKNKSGFSLNFENADISEVVSIIIGKIMNDNYLIDPSVKGVVNLRTVKDLDKEAVFYVLENILDIHGAKVVRYDGHYRILPKSKQALGMVVIANDRHSKKIGYGYRVVPLKYIPAVEMVKILETVTNKSSVIRSDDKRNMLILGGSSQDVTNMLDTVKLFDVDWMKGTNIALIKINYSDVKDIIDDLHTMYQAGEHKKTGVIKIEPIQRLNAIMVISKNYEDIDRVRDWVGKLDQPAGGEGKKLYVYSIKYTNAEELSETLNDLFKSGSVASDESKTESLEPGSKPITIQTMNAPEGNNDANSTAEVKSDNKYGIRIIAAKDSNSLLIMSTPGEYSKIIEALELLDIPPLQVLVEVTIMDVRLTDELSYGMQWFFNSTRNGFDNELQVGDSLAFSQSFSYSAVKQNGNVRSILGMLAADGRVDVLSSPSVLVRNNEKASIRVGDQQPINTALIGPEGNIVASSVQFKDTGVILEIKPTVNKSGTVNVSISQEVTDIGDIDDATGQRAFLRRSLKSSVSVADGETIILGGLIRSNKAETESGVPGLKDVPLLGALFGKTITSEQRTELLVMLTPKIIRDAKENTIVVDEYKKKFKNMFNTSRQ